MKLLGANQKIILATCLAGASFACTGQLPGSFRLAQQEQTFNSQLQINTKIDLLWVVDNSSSMDITQEKLRQGFSGFARKYMQPTWDIRVAVITTDTYIAHPAFSGYLNRVIPGTTGWTSPYILSRLNTFRNPPSNPSLVNLSTGAFPNGVKYNDLIPTWGPTYSLLLPGIHDGPIAALCFEGHTYFLNGVTQCRIRDDQTRYNGPGHCLRPETGESSVSQCVNTLQNDTNHSGTAIISTMPPAGTVADEVWAQRLIDQFTVNVTTGTSGLGSERGLGSVLQLIQDNEQSPTVFFRPGSLRGIIFVGDEDDQTLQIPSSPDSSFSPWTGYKCDQTSLVAMNGSGPITGTNGYCCTTTSNNCRFGSEGTACPSKTIDGFTYAPSICPRDDLLIPVENVKTQLDSFFSTLDGGSGSPNYFIVSIVALTGNAIQSLQASRNEDDARTGTLRTVATDRADRYITLGNQVGNGSLAMNIADSDYSVLLDQIGKTIIEKKSVFTLDRAPTSEEDMIVKVIHADGTSSVIPSDQFIISGKSLIITDRELFLSFKATDQVVINYQPKTVF